jgi:nucleotide-binding universal stress UspA family protein
MVFKDLILLIGKGTEAAGPYGVWLATACGATLTAASPVIEPDLPPYIVMEMPDEILSRIREEAATDADNVLRAVSELAKQTGISVETVAFQARDIDVDEEFSRLARHFDVTVIEQPNPEGVDTSGRIEATLFGSGRPILVVPYIGARQEIGTAVIAWDGGPRAARAVGDALPLLRIASRVEIVTIEGINDVNERRRMSSEMMAQHLGRHGIPAEAKRLISDGNVAELLLSHVSDVDGNLIVMGGYGHSRLREVVLGGTTREILRSMTVPVLMAH